MAVDLKLYEKASNLIKREDMVKLLRELVNIKSPFFEEGEIIDYLRGRLSYYNRLQADIHRYEEPDITGFKGENLIVRLHGKGGGPKMLINGHVDTVPLCDGWTVDPYAGVEKDGRLYGLGALDMKAGIVASVFLLEALVEAGIELKGDLLFTAVSDEEGPYGLGTHYTIVDGITEGTDLCIIPEPSGPFAPGSEMVVVWKNSVFTFKEANSLIMQSDEDLNRDYFYNLSHTIGSPAANSFSIKVLYYIDYQYLKKLRRSH